MSSVNTEATSAEEKPSRWKLWKSFRLINRKSACADREAGKRKGVGDAGKTDVERAAICIQTAFRRFLAKRALRALKGLARLQAAISGHDSRKQSAASLHCIQAFVRVQARIHRERAIQSRDALGLPQYKVADPTVETCTADSEMEWCNALGTVEEIQAREQQKQVAAIKRDRAIAYAFCNKWKANVKVNPGSLFDYELDNSTWSWIWLDEWLNGQPKKECINGKKGSERVINKDGATKKLVLKKTATVGFRNYLNSKISPDRSNEIKKTPTRAGSPGRTLKVRVGSPGRTLKARVGKGKGMKVLSLKPNAKLQPGQSLNQSKQQPNKDVNSKVLSPNPK